MNEKDEKILAAMAGYDASVVGSSERLSYAQSIEKTSAGVSERDIARISCEYARRMAGINKGDKQ